METLTTSIIRFDSIGSTNTEAASWAMQGAPEGLCIVASEQTAGRGRLARQWVSPKNAGLYFSIVLRPRIEPKSLPLITLMASLAVRDSLSEVYGLETDIKWPNDVLAENRKLCGILAEVVDSAAGRAVIVGIGINLTRDSFPHELQSIATSVEGVTGRSADPEKLLQSLIRNFARQYAVLQSENGGAKIIDAWCRASSYATGKRIRFTNSNQSIEGTTRGLESDGALRLETESGEIRILRAGDVTVRPTE